ncbi:28S ribosomal protein S6, mitochondrial [Myotis lucifugus]|nr:28S ribosomal protein S6, mitochondrial [Myotis lucifugus]
MGRPCQARRMLAREPHCTWCDKSSPAEQWAPLCPGKQGRLLQVPPFPISPSLGSGCGSSEGTAPPVSPGGSLPQVQPGDSTGRGFSHTTAVPAPLAPVQAPPGGNCPRGAGAGGRACRFAGEDRPAASRRRQLLVPAPGRDAAGAEILLRDVGNVVRCVENRILKLDRYWEENGWKSSPCGAFTAGAAVSGAPGEAGGSAHSAALGGPPGSLGQRLHSKLPETAAALKRTIEALMDRGAIVRNLENLGERMLPYRISAHSQRHNRGGYFLVDFYAPTTTVESMLDHLSRDIDVIRPNIVKHPLTQEVKACEGIVPVPLEEKLYSTKRRK